MFLAKITFVILGMVTIGLLQPALNRDAGQWATAAPPARIRLIAGLSMFFWLGAIITGRLIAYL
jgi:hypothetical protein